MLATDLKVKIFSDGADLASMLEVARNPLVKGVTTNPSLMRKAGVKEYRSYAKEVLSKITDIPVSLEVFADEIGEMRKQALEIATWGKNVYVKIPVINSEGQSTVSLIEEISHKNVRVNVTAILTLDQVIDTCKALKGGAPSIVSVFAGRIADTGCDPMPIMRASLALCQAAGKDVELLWASTREVYNIRQADDMGCPIITVPNDIIKKMSGWGKDLFSVSVDTVRTFKKDSEGYSL